MMIKLLLVTLSSLAGNFDQRTTSGNPFDQKGLVARQAEPKLFGKVSSGCLVGAKPLSFRSPNYIVLGRKRNAYWGHPLLIKKIDKWARWTKYHLNRKFKVADIGLPYGGPATPRHGTHQQGIDVDIPLALEPVNRRSIDANSYSSPEIGVLDVIRADELNDGRVKYILDSRVTAFWNERIYRLIKHVASDPDVSRIIVNPSIRQKICTRAGVARRAEQRRSRKEVLDPKSIPEDLKWVRKLRFFGGHTYHMHVRVHACIGLENCPRSLAPAYRGTDWGLGCDTASGPNSYWHGDYVYYFDPNQIFSPAKTFLQQRAINNECKKNNGTFCTGFHDTQAAIESRLTQTENSLPADSNKACYNISVKRDNHELFQITKCVPKVCDEIIRNL